MGGHARGCPRKAERHVDERVKLAMGCPSCSSAIPYMATKSIDVGNMFGGCWWRFWVDVGGGVDECLERCLAHLLREFVRV